MEGTAANALREQPPTLVAIVLEAVNVRVLAEFYRVLLGYRYAPGDEWPPPGQPDHKAAGWIVLTEDTGRPRIAIQRVPARPSATTDIAVRQQVRVITCVPTTADLAVQRAHAVGLGATVLDGGSDDDEAQVCILADPAGHPFCILVGALPD